MMLSIVLVIVVKLSSGLEEGVEKEA